MNEILTYQVLQAALDIGVKEFVLCPGSRNSSFVQALKSEQSITSYYMFEERSSAFFALGRCQATHRPVAVITTSGTAVGELLPAVMEAYYTGIPLLLISADRPRNFRGKGAPQSAEQVGIFGLYAPFFLDLAAGDSCDFTGWNQCAPAHINVCLAEPQSQPPWQGKTLKLQESDRPLPVVSKQAAVQLNRFLSTVKYPLVVVGSLRQDTREQVAQFLLKLNAPVVLEGISGLREDDRLKPLCIRRSEKILRSAIQADYAIDGVLRIGGVPTQRLWRDLEYLQGKVQVCSITEVPFSGLSWSGELITTPIDLFLQDYDCPNQSFADLAKKWLTEDQLFKARMFELFEEEPAAEPSLMYELSCCISDQAHVYLGNSLPIREWDMAASFDQRGFVVKASRGLSGIDGQLSTFLGTCIPYAENWGIFGDLTALYDMSAPWILSQLHHIQAHFVIINNGGGKIFDRMYSDIEMQNCHQLNFEPLARMWGIPYERWESVPERIGHPAGVQMIEIIPDHGATKRFWGSLTKEFTLVAG